MTQYAPAQTHQANIACPHMPDRWPCAVEMRQVLEQEPLAAALVASVALQPALPSLGSPPSGAVGCRQFRGRQPKLLDD